MPANLPPDYIEAEKRFREAQSPADKVAILEEMLAIMPHHKGTDKLRAGLRRKLSKLKDEQESKKGSSRASLYTVKREGAGQIALVGMPNAEKSQLLTFLTNAEPDIGDYPFTTLLPQTGMMVFENVQIQLVDLPPLSEEHVEGWVFNVLQGADALMLVLNLGADPLTEMEILLTLLETRRIVPVRELPDEDSAGLYHKRVLVVGNKADVPVARENFSVIQELYGSRFPLEPVSAISGGGLETMPKKLFDLLNILRVYPKRPGHDPDMTNPVTLTEGSTILDLAKEIHKDFLSNLRFARVWGSSRFDGQKVQRDYVLRDGDIVEMRL